MPKPTMQPILASDPTFLNGPQTGFATKIDAGAAYYKQGYKPGERLIGEYVNYYVNNMALWNDYLRIFETEAHTWTGSGSIPGGASITGGIVNTTTLAVSGSTTANATLVAGTTGFRGNGGNNLASVTAPSIQSSGTIQINGTLSNTAAAQPISNVAGLTITAGGMNTTGATDVVLASSGNLSVSGSVTANGSTVSVSGGNLAVTGNSTWNLGTVSGTTNVGGTTTTNVSPDGRITTNFATVLAGGVDITGNSTITGTLGGVNGLTVSSGGATTAGNFTASAGTITTSGVVAVSGTTNINGTTTASNGMTAGSMSATGTFTTASSGTYVYQSNTLFTRRLQLAAGKFPTGGTISDDGEVHITNNNAVFHRSFTVPATAQLDNVTARVRYGITGGNQMKLELFIYDLSGNLITTLGPAFPTPSNPFPAYTDLSVDVTVASHRDPNNTFVVRITTSGTTQDHQINRISVRSSHSSPLYSK